MKNSLLNFLRKYRTLLLLNIIMLIGMVFSKIFGDLYIIKRDFFSFNLHTIYIFVVLPIYSFAYGCISYIICKKVWFPQILLAVAMILGFLLAELISFGDNGLIVAILILIPLYTIFSIVVSAVTKIIYKN